MQVASVDPDGLPDVRTVLLKGFDRRGFTFYTNYESAKGTQILQAGRAALVFHWKSRRRQVRARGPIEKVSDEEADAYYASRPRGSRIGAWASEQSRPLESRETLMRRTAELEAKYEGGRHSPPAALGRHPHRAKPDRVLAGRRVPPPRPHRVPPRGQRLVRAADEPIRG